MYYAITLYGKADPSRNPVRYIPNNQDRDTESCAGACFPPCIQPLKSLGVLPGSNIHVWGGNGLALELISSCQIFFFITALLRASPNI